MSALISTLLFAATATASITTTIRVPAKYGYYEDSDYNLVGSVVAVDGDKTTLELKYQYGLETDYYDYEPETYTLQGTRIEGHSSASDVDGYGAMTAALACDVPSTGAATCTYSVNGAYLANQYCEDMSYYLTPTANVYVYTYPADEYGPASTETVVETYDYASEYPSELTEFCKTGGTELPEKLAVETRAFPQAYISDYQVIITAGEEKLGATAGATPYNSEAKPTGTMPPTVTRRITASSTASPSTVSPSGSTDVPAAPESTGAAASLRAMVPALMGLGAAMAAFVW